MIWQAQNRFAFANSAEDADLIANELAILTFNSMDIKLRLESVRQRVAGHRIVWLKSRGINVSSGEGSTSQDVIGFGQSLGKSWSDDSDKSSNSESESSSRGQSTGRSKTVSTSESNSESQSVLPILEDIKETSSIQFRSFDEFRLEWMKIIRQLKTGNCFAKLYNDDHLYKLKVDYRKLRDSRDVQARIDDLKQRNYEQDLFISSAEADRLREEARQQLLARPRISLPGPITFQSADQNESGEIPPVDTRPASMPDPFRKPKRKD
jgi:hypothetical protein